MSEIRTNLDVKSIELQAVVTRADGKVEELGTIAYFHKNPFKNLLGQFKVRK